MLSSRVSRRFFLSFSHKVLELGTSSTTFLRRKYQKWSENQFLKPWWEKNPGEARFFTIHCQVHHHTLFKNIYVGHLHFISSKCHILTSDTLSWHLFFKTLYSTSSALYHFLLHISISTRFDWPIKRAIIHCIVSIPSSLLLGRSFGSSPPPDPVLGTRTHDEPPRTSGWETNSQTLFGKNEPALQPRSQGSLVPVPTERDG